MPDIVYIAKSKQKKEKLCWISNKHGFFLARFGSLNSEVLYLSGILFDKVRVER
jgi:hypothetical protein